MESIRIWRSPYSRFANFVKEANDLKDETVTANAVYSDDVLAGIAASGFNAIWVHGLLRNIVTSKIFPEFGANSEAHIANLRELMNRAGGHGIKVFIYMQPPRGIENDSDFWDKHPEVAGHLNNTSYTDDFDQLVMRSFCTSTRKAKEYLFDSSARLASLLPDLGGIILITASEFPSHCYGKTGLIDDKGIPTGKTTNCPHCVDRSPIDVITEIIQLTRDGVRSESDEMKIVAWNWSWSSYEMYPCRKFIDKLPRDIIFMADFERGGEKKILDKVRLINEYSLTYSGPSTQFTEEAAMAHSKGCEIMAKLQIGTTHELATVPNLPLIGNIFDKVAGMRDAGIAHYMGCWNFGNMLTANSAAINYFLDMPEYLRKDAALRSFAVHYFPDCDPDLVAEAWKLFSAAGDSFPFNTPFTYNGPLNYSVVYPSRPEPLDDIPCGRSWMFDSPRGDDLSKSIYEFTLDELITGMGEVTEKWLTALNKLKDGVRSSLSNHSEEEISSAAGGYHSFRSIWNTYRIYRLRLEWNDSKMDDYRSIAVNEIENLKLYAPIVEKDDRLGYHGEAFGHMYNAEMIKEKIELFEEQL